MGRESEGEFAPMLAPNLTNPGYLIEHWTLFGWEGIERVESRKVKDGDCGCEEWACRGSRSLLVRAREKGRGKKKRKTKEKERPLPARNLSYIVSHMIRYCTRAPCPGTTSRKGEPALDPSRDQVPSEGGAKRKQFKNLKENHSPNPVLHQHSYILPESSAQVKIERQVWEERKFDIIRNHEANTRAICSVYLR